MTVRVLHRELKLKKHGKTLEDLGDLEDTCHGTRWTDIGITPETLGGHQEIRRTPRPKETSARTEYPCKMEDFGEIGGLLGRKRSWHGRRTSGKWRTLGKIGGHPEDFGGFWGTLEDSKNLREDTWSPLPIAPAMGRAKMSKNFYYIITFLVLSSI